MHKKGISDGGRSRTYMFKKYLWTLADKSKEASMTWSCPFLTSKCVFLANSNISQLFQQVDLFVPGAIYETNPKYLTENREISVVERFTFEMVEGWKENKVGNFNSSRFCWHHLVLKWSKTRSKVFHYIPMKVASVSSICTPYMKNIASLSQAKLFLEDQHLLKGRKYHHQLPIIVMHFFQILFA